MWPNEPVEEDISDVPALARKATAADHAAALGVTGLLT
jgi:hypothetical protein